MILGFSEIAEGSSFGLERAGKFCTSSSGAGKISEDK